MSTEQTFLPVTVTLPLAGLPPKCPYCGDTPPGGEWELTPHHGLIYVTCSHCFTAVTPVRAVAVKDEIQALREQIGVLSKALDLHGIIRR